VEEIMRSIGRIVAIAWLLFACPRLASADDVAIKKGHFRYNGDTWFRRAAHTIVLGAFGEKKTPLGGSNYLAVEDRIPAKHLAVYGKVHKSHPVEIDWEKHSKTDVSADFGFKYFTLKGEAAMTGDYETFKSAKLKLIMIWMDEGPTKTTINHSDGVRNFLRKEGRDGRVVVGLCIAVDGELAKHFENSTLVTLSGQADGGVVEITAKQSAGSTTSGSHTIKLPPRSVFGYRLAKVKSWDKNKTLVTNMTIDQPGGN
jgi:hypothetical protein